MIFDRAIPPFAQAQHRAGAIAGILGRAGLGLDDVDRFACHPGGAKVIDALERALSLGQGSLDHERIVLADYGNMSAPTALFVLERLIEAGLPSRTLLTAMGPGFTASCVSLQESRVTPAVLLLALVTLGAAGRALARPPQHRGPAGARARSKSRPEHYPLIVLLHALWLSGLWFLGWAQPVSLPWLAVFLVLQLLRVWVLLTLGRRWTTRIIVLPGAPLVANGPYRYVSHPNYLVVVGEIAVLPLCLGLPWYALIFSAANAVSPGDPDPRGERGAGRSAQWSRCSDTPPAEPVSGGHLDRLRRDVRRHVHGHPRRADRRDVAADDPGRPRHRARPDELGADRLPDCRSHRDPSDRVSDCAC